MAVRDSVFYVDDSRLETVGPTMSIREAIDHMFERCRDATFHDFIHGGLTVVTAGALCLNVRSAACDLVLKRLTLLPQLALALVRCTPPPSNASPTPAAAHVFHGRGDRQSSLLRLSHSVSWQSQASRATPWAVVADICNMLAAVFTDEPTHSHQDGEHHIRKVQMVSPGYCDGFATAKALGPVARLTVRWRFRRIHRSLLSQLALSSYA